MRTFSGLMKEMGALVSDQVPNPGTRVPPQTTVRLYFYEEEIAQEVSVPSF